MDGSQLVSCDANPMWPPNKLQRRWKKKRKRKKRKGLEDMGGDCHVNQRKIYRCCFCYLLLLLLLLLCMPSLLLPSVAAAAAGEILGELQQRFMSCPPAGGLLAAPGKDRLGKQGLISTKLFREILFEWMQICAESNNHKLKHNLLFPPVRLLAGAAVWLNCFTGFPIWSFSSKQAKGGQMCRCFAMSTFPLFWTDPPFSHLRFSFFRLSPAPTSFWLHKISLDWVGWEETKLLGVSESLSFSPFLSMFQGKTLGESISVDDLPHFVGVGNLA